MSCGDKIHQVRRKWQKEKERTDAQTRREQEEKDKGIPIEEYGWPGVAVPRVEPAKVAG